MTDYVLQKSEKNESKGHTPLGTCGYFLRIDISDGFLPRTRRKHHFFSFADVFVSIHKMGKRLAMKKSRFHLKT